MGSLVTTRPLVVVGGGGRIGRALLRMQPDAQHLAVGRADLGTLGARLAAAADEPAPILVATTNDALPEVVAACPPERRPDLVFLQNGMLLPLLEQHGLAGNTQALLYMSASADGSCSDGGRTVACGRWAGELAALLRAGGVQCAVVGAADYLSLLIDKLLWASILWLLSAGLGGLPVGDVARRHGAAQQELAGELLPLAQAYLAAAARRLQLPGGAEQVEALTVQQACAGLDAYSLSIPAAVPSRQMALAEFAWRNGWFLGQCRTPAHVGWLRRAGVEA